MTVHGTLRIALFAAALIVSGCASQPVLPDNQAFVAPNAILTLPPPSALGQSVDLAQSVVVHYRSRTFTFDTQIQIRPDKIDLVALDGFGQRTLTVTWKADKIEYRPSSWFPQDLRAANILADFVIAYWPAAALAPQVRAAGATLEETATGRRISRGHRDLVDVEYGSGEGWNRSAKLHNLAFGYEIDIQSTVNAP